MSDKTCLNCANCQVAARVVTCVYCGHKYDDGTPTSQDERLTAHIRQCPKHPMRELDKQIADLKTELAQMWQVSTKCADDLRAENAKLQAEYEKLRGALIALHFVPDSDWDTLITDIDERMDAQLTTRQHCVELVVENRELKALCREAAQIIPEAITSNPSAGWEIADRLGKVGCGTRTLKEVRE